jgi:hypothetical protein
MHAHSLRRVIAAASCATGTVFCATAHADTGIQLVVNGLAVSNVAAAPSTAAFTSWCAGVCFPTTHQVVHDPGNGQAKGAIYVWGKNFQFGAGGTLCFSEFIVFALDQGDIHVASGDRGTCGAQMDPALKPPLHADKGALVVIAGGGDGTVVGGTGKYMNWSGTYTDRVFVGFGLPTSGVGGIVYYDQLWFGISGK